MTAGLTLSAREVADALGISVSTVYEMVARHEIPNVAPGRAVRIPRSWLEQQYAAAGVTLEEPATA